MQKLLSFVLVLCFFLLPLAGCAWASDRKNVYVLYTSDVHCALDEGLGYAAFAGYAEKLRSKFPYVTLLDCGDAVQGAPFATVSRGEYPVRIMNEIGYDFALLGKHEFDYGIERLSELVEQSNAEYLACNLTYSGSGTNLLSAVKPYAIRQYGDVTVGFVGVSAPDSIRSALSQELAGETDYSFSADTWAQFYAGVQNSVDACRAEGADYVVALTHMGADETSKPYRSRDLIAVTNGVDAVLDGNSDVAVCEYYDNKDGVPTLLSCAGTKLNSFGQLTITPDGKLSAELIRDDSFVSDSVRDLLNTVREEYQVKAATVLTDSAFALEAEDASGVRIVGNRECSLGNFCADAYRVVSGADVALVSAGSIRTGLKQGEISYEDLIAIQPDAGTLCVVEATGQQILDALEMAYREVELESADPSDVKGDNSGFLHLSGLCATVETSTPSSVVTDESGAFVAVEGVRRVWDVRVLQADGSSVPLRKEQTYTLASNSNLIRECAFGMTMFEKATLLFDSGMESHQVLINFLEQCMGGKLDEGYRREEGRVRIFSHDYTDENAQNTEPMQITLMSFNTQHCQNFLTQKIDFDVMAEAIRTCDADVIGLQEMRDKGENPYYQEQARILAEKLGYYYYFAEAIRFNGVNPYGNALLSRYPIKAVHTEMIPDPVSPAYDGYYETRCVLVAELDVPGGLRVCVSHFGLNPDEQENAVNTVLPLLRDTRCVLMGDLNVLPDDPLLEPIQKRMNDTAEAFDAEKFSYPSDNPTSKLDYIFTSPDLSVLDADIPPIVAADHRPHIATVYLGD